MLNKCPVCKADWNPETTYVLRKPLKHIRCPECLKERKARIKLVEGKESRRVHSIKSRFEGMSDEERRKEAQRDIEALF